MTRGFTLLEIVVAMAIAVIILTALSSIFIVQYNLYFLGSTSVDLNSSLTATLRAMEEFGTSARAIVNTRDFGGTNFTTSNTTLVLALPSVDPGGNPLPQTDYVVFFRDPVQGQKLWMQIDADATSSRRDLTKLFSDLTNILQFSYNKSNPAEATIVEVFVSLRKVAKGNPQETSGRTSIFLRNK